MPSLLAPCSWTFQPPGLWEVSAYCLSHPNLWYFFATAAQIDRDIYRSLRTRRANKFHWKYHLQSTGSGFLECDAEKRRYIQVQKKGEDWVLSKICHEHWRVVSMWATFLLILIGDYILLILLLVFDGNEQLLFFNPPELNLSSP